MTTSPDQSGPATVVPAEPVTTVSGHSDDCIELDGAIYDEWLHYGPGAGRLVFDNGVVLDIEYDRDRDGVWRINVLEGHDRVTLTTCPDPEDDDGYGTDTADVVGARSVTFGEHTATLRQR